MAGVRCGRFPASHARRSPYPEGGSSGGASAGRRNRRPGGHQFRSASTRGDHRPDPPRRAPDLVEGGWSPRARVRRALCADRDGAVRLYRAGPGLAPGRVALGSVGPTIIRATEAEAFIAAAIKDAGAWADPAVDLPDDKLREFSEQVALAARPIDDVRGTAAYRVHALKVLARRALNWALEERRLRRWL